MMKQYTLKDMIYITLFATIATASKAPLAVASGFFAGTFGLPGGIINGVYYMFWIVAACALTQKRGTATLFCIIQAFLGMYISGFPLIKLVTFIPPGIAVDILYVLIDHRACCRYCMILGGMAANVAGALSMALLFLKVPAEGLIITGLVAGISGGIGGYAAYIVVKKLVIILPSLNMHNK